MINMPIHLVTYYILVLKGMMIMLNNNNNNIKYTSSHYIQ
jgi:hypothetical protein